MNIYETMEKILALKKEEEKLMAELKNQLGGQVKIESLAKSVKNGFSEDKSYWHTDDTLECLDLSETARNILYSHGVEYFYDVEDGIALSTLKAWCDKDFKSFNEIFAAFSDWGIPLVKDIDVSERIVNVITPHKIEPEIDPKYKQKPYINKIKDLTDLDTLARNMLVKAGYKTVYDVYVTPKKKLLKNVKRFGLGSYDKVREYFETNFNLSMEPTRKAVKIKDATW